ncbi:MAG: Arc family DNA-binding protein [Chloroflexi bacterium]|nr:Arc family DNA-binding protein [Chloroflexota bacterium]
MATLTLKNVPEKLVQRLKEEAKQNRRSLNQETLARLEVSVTVRRPGGEETVVKLRKLHNKLAGLPPLTDKFLARARNKGRP